MRLLAGRRIPPELFPTIPFILTQNNVQKPTTLTKVQNKYFLDLLIKITLWQNELPVLMQLLEDRNLVQPSSSNAYNGIAPETSQAHRIPKKKEICSQQQPVAGVMYITHSIFHFQHVLRIATLILFNGKTYCLGILSF